MDIIRREGSVAPTQLLSPDGSADSVSLNGLLAQLYKLRGAGDPAQTDYSLKHLLPPGDLLGLPEATAVLVDAVQRERAIVVVGDFDVDGATSTALAVTALRAMGHRQVDFLVPNRFKFGYGLSAEIVEVARQRGAQLIVTVDNGVSSLAGVAAANAAGIDVLVTDHHLPGAQLPAAAAMVNPNQPGCGFASKALAGVGVIFYVMTALRRGLRDTGWFVRQGLPEPNMAQFLDLVALGTVADVVPLDYNNRIFVHQGVIRMRAGKLRPGIAALFRIAGRRTDNMVAADLGFAVGPRLNAAGRLDDMTHGILCLMSRDSAEADRFAGELDALNVERREIEQDMKEQAVAFVERLDLSAADLPFGLCLFEAGWHQGVVGILAARIREKYHRPVIAFAETGQGDGLIKGSGRSVPGLHIRDALEQVAARHPGLIRKFGGHAMAAGLELAEVDYTVFAEAFDLVVREQLTADVLCGSIVSDGELPASCLGLELAQLLRNSGPWGQHFPEPIFDGEFAVLAQRLVGKKHLKLSLAPASDPTNKFDAIWFNIDPGQWPCQSVSLARVAYRLDVNEYRGFVNPQLLVDHLEPIHKKATVLPASNKASNRAPGSGMGIALNGAVG